MKAPRFWWKPSPSAAATLLAPAARIYGRYAAARMRRPPSYHARMPVICVGSLTVGGDGKTPTALALGAFAKDAGLSPGFLTRGYGGAGTALLVDLARDGPDRTGDEARLLAEAGPTVVSADRARGAQLLETTDADLIIMDDGFQNPDLHKDASLVVVDAAVGFGNGRVTPAGPLRAPLASQFPLADVIVLIGDGAAEESVRRMASAAGKPPIRARLEPVDAGAWRGVAVHAFAGIGRPEKFFASLEAAGANVVARSAFPDHHRYREKDARRLLRSVSSGGARLVTTAKDHARLAGSAGELHALRERSDVFEVRLEFAEQETVRRLLASMIERR